jgi:hypothetical protein
LDIHALQRYPNNIYFEDVDIYLQISLLKISFEDIDIYFSGLKKKLEKELELLQQEIVIQK